MISLFSTSSAREALTRRIRPKRSAAAGSRICCSREARTSAAVAQSQICLIVRGEALGKIMYPAVAFALLVRLQHHRPRQHLVAGAAAPCASALSGDMVSFLTHIRTTELLLTSSRSASAMREVDVQSFAEVNPTLTWTGVRRYISSLGKAFPIHDGPKLPSPQRLKCFQPTSS